MTEWDQRSQLLWCDRRVKKTWKNLKHIGGPQAKKKVSASACGCTQNHRTAWVRRDLKRSTGSTLHGRESLDESPGHVLKTSRLYHVPGEVVPVTVFSWCCSSAAVSIYKLSIVTKTAETTLYNNFILFYSNIYASSYKYLASMWLAGRWDHGISYNAFFMKNSSNIYENPIYSLIFRTATKIWG